MLLKPLECNRTVQSMGCEVEETSTKNQTADDHIFEDLLIGETFSKNQTADDHIPDDSQIAGNHEAKGSKGCFNLRLINWWIFSCHHLMGPSVLNSAKAMKQHKTVTLAEDGMENEFTKTQMADRKSISKITVFLSLKKAVEDLRRQRENLTLAQERLRIFVEVAKRHNEDIEEDVDNWLTEADIALDDTQMLENETKENKRFFCNMFPNWRWRYRLSKKVAKRILTAIALASKFERVRSLAKLSGHKFFLSEGFVLFYTHLSALNRIMDAFKDERVYLIGLHGIDGVGKTALAKEVAKMAKKLRLFEKVVMVELSPVTNIMSIQDEIAESLEFTFEDHGVDRNQQLQLRLLQENPILIIVDDFLSIRDLEDIGIPFPSFTSGRGSKLLLTTRRDEVCFNLYLNNRMVVRLDPLTDAEALELFKMIAGLNRSSSAFNVVAMEIVKQCYGLPIAIGVAAKALKGKTLEEWKEASANFRGKTLEEWQDFSRILGRPTLIDESFEKVYCGFRQLQLSYDCLSRETKLCFLMYSLFPEDVKIHVEDLVSCSIGMELYGKLDSMKNYRRRILEESQKLKESRMLLDDVKEYIYTMTKMIHDAALLIGSKEEEFKIRSEVGSKEWPKNESFELYSAVSMMSTKMEEIDEGFVSEKLRILFLGGDGSMTISSTSKVFQGLEALRVFILVDGLLSLDALQSLTDLRVLRLKQCKVHDVSSLAKLKKLEILSFRGTNIRELPEEVGELYCLKVLDLSECQVLQKIHPNVIQRLGQLEELLISDSFENWHLEETNAGDRNASLSELKALSNLCGLSLKFRSVHLPKDFVFPQLEYFQIAMNENGWFEDCYYPKSLKVSTTSSLNALKELLANVRDLRLNRIKGYQNLFPSFEISPLLCFLSLTCCQDIECIVDTTKFSEEKAFGILRGLFLEEMTKLKEISKGQPPDLLFAFLETLNVTKCNNLIVAVPGVVLDMLQEIRVKDCHKMEQIFHEPSHTDQMLLHAGDKNLMQHFSSLTNLELVNLPELRCIWNSNVCLRFPSLRILEITNCSKLETVFPSPTNEVGEDFLHLRIRDKLEGLPPLNPCNGFQIDEMLAWIAMVIALELDNDIVRQSEQGIRQVEEEERDNIMLPKLQRLVLRSLKNLRSFCAGMDFIPLPSLEELVVEECPLLTPFIIPQNATKRLYLKELSLSKVGISNIQSGLEPEWNGRSPNSESVVVGNFEEIFQVGGGYFFSKLEKLVVKDLSQLKVIWKDPTQILTFQNLTYFELANCEGMTNIFSLVAARNLPQLRHLKVQGCENLEQIIVQDEVASSSSCKAHSGDIYFPNLIRIHVKKCNRLKALFPICVANLPKLKELLVSEASRLKQIFAHEGEANVVLDKDEKEANKLPKLKVLLPTKNVLEKDEMVLKYEKEGKLPKLKVLLLEDDLQDKDEMVVNSEKEIELPKLKVLLLEDLPILLSFIPVGYRLKFPSLFSPTVKNCPKISTIFSSDLNNTLHAKTKKFQLQEDIIHQQ